MKIENWQHPPIIKTSAWYCDVVWGGNHSVLDMPTPAILTC